MQTQHIIDQQQIDKIAQSILRNVNEYLAIKHAFAKPKMEWRHMDAPRIYKDVLIECIRDELSKIQLDVTTTTTHDIVLTYPKK